MAETFATLPSTKDDRSFFSYVLSALGVVAQRVVIVDQSEASFSHGGLSSIGATPLQITATPTPLKKGVYIRARDGNGANLLAVGNSNAVTVNAADGTDGFELAKNEQVFIPVNDLSKVWIVGSTTGLELSWWAV